MADAKQKLVVGILALPESTASTLYGMHEILASAGRDWDLLVTGCPGEPKILPVIVSADGAPLRTHGGLRRRTRVQFGKLSRTRRDCHPRLMVAPEEELSGRYREEIVWIEARHAKAVLLATACTGALVLAEAGLLDGQDATVHWGYCEVMATRHPAVRVHPNRALVISGEGQLVGGETSWHDLALLLVARFFGTEEAMRMARLNLIDSHHVGQQPFASLTCKHQVDDAVIARCQEWITRNYEHNSPVSTMVRLSGLAERSFKRRFIRSTGMSPLEYVHTIRLEESKHLLETTDLPVEAVVNDVGYEDGSFFGRLFRRKVGLTPANIGSGSVPCDACSSRVQAARMQTAQAAELSRDPLKQPGFPRSMRGLNASYGISVAGRGWRRGSERRRRR